VDAFQRDRTLAAARRLGNVKAERFARRDGFLDFVHPLDLLELAHRLRSLGGDLAKPLIELLQRADFLLLVVVGGELLLVGGLALAQKIRVVAGVGKEPHFVDLVDGLDDLVHELPVMGNEKDRATIGLQILLEPEE